MTGGSSRIAVAVVLVAMLGLGAAGCGGDDGATTQSTDGNAGGNSGAAGPEAGFEPAPLRISGGGSDQFAAEGGDDPALSFGEESDESELEEAAEAVHAFYVARAEGDWAGTCSRIAESLGKKLKQLAAQTEHRDCASFLEAFTTPMSDAAWREVTEIDAASLRRNGEKAFLIYRGADDEVYAMPLRNEEGEWRVEELAAPTLS